MAKDPAILFYTSDFLTGTMIMSHEQVGIYIRLICFLHQHGGEMTLDAFNAFIGTHEIIRSKFRVTEDGMVYHHRLTQEMAKRSKKSSSLSDNAKKRWSNMQLHNKSIEKASCLHMPIENANEDENVIRIDNDVKEVFGYFCMKTGKKILLSPERKRIILSRLHQGRTKDEMLKAIENFVKDDWADRHRFCDIVYCLGVRNKVDNLDKWLVGKREGAEKTWPIHHKTCPDCFGNGYEIAQGGGAKVACRRKMEVMI
jgi:uncharacterized protein YdaU (DUF1376 family)